jgi:hypothetical protein
LGHSLPPSVRRGESFARVVTLIKVRIGANSNLDQTLRIYRERRSEIERDGFDVTKGK